MHLSLRRSHKELIRGLVSHLVSISHTQTLLLSPNCVDIFIHLGTSNELLCSFCFSLEDAKVFLCEKDGKKI